MMDAGAARRMMVERQLKSRGVIDERVLAAMNEVPRESFVEQGFEELAYEDCALPISEGQTISQPYIVGFMAEAADIEPGDRVLEIGGGSGYGAAIVSRLAKEVFVIERLPRLVERARERWRVLGYDNIEIRCGDGTKGWPEKAPFDSIIVTAGAPDVPRSLPEQLAIGGVLVIPIGGRSEQQLRRIRRVSETEFDSEDIGLVVFVPLIGEEGSRLP